MNVTGHMQGLDHETLNLLTVGGVKVVLFNLLSAVFCIIIFFYSHRQVY